MVVNEEEEPEEEMEAGRERGGSRPHTTGLHISSRAALRADLFAAG